MKQRAAIKPRAARARTRCSRTTDRHRASPDLSSGGCEPIGRPQGQHKNKMMPSMELSATREELSQGARESLPRLPRLSMPSRMHSSAGGSSSFYPRDTAVRDDPPSKALDKVGILVLFLLGAARSFSTP